MALEPDRVTPLHARAERRRPSTPAERLLELMPGLLVTTGLDGRLTFVSSASERLLGWRGEDLIGQHALEFVHEADRAQFSACLANAAERPGEEHVVECRCITRAGNWRWITWHVRNEDGQWYGAGHDTTHGHEARDELARSEARLAEAQRVAGVGSYELDVRTGELSWSDEHYRIYGVSPDSFELTTENAQALVHPDDAELVRERRARTQTTTAESGTLEYRIVRPDGQVRTLLVRGRMIYDDDGTLLRIVGTSQDVTEQRAAQRALAVGSRRLRALVEQVPAIVYTAGLGADAPWDYVSPQIETMLGYSADEWMADRSLWFSALHPDDRERVLDEESVATEPGRQVSSEYRLRTRGGDWVWVRDQMTAIEDEHGELRLQGVLLDITEAREAREALADKHGQLQAIIDNSPLIVFAKDTEHRYLFVNREFEELYDVAQDEVVGNADADLMPRELAVKLDENDTRVLETGAPIEVEETVRSARGELRTFISHKFPLRDAAGLVYGICGIATDITERKAREDALHAKVEWSFRIRDAIESERFVLHSQPIVDVATGRAVQEELLIRMIGDSDEIVMPGDFLPPAERFGLAPDIDRWVISQAARLGRDRRVEVNLSGQSIGDPTLTEFIERELEAAGTTPSNLVFEITETAAAEDLDEARRLADRLTELGCGFALDDFGTGYGSFTYLKHLPVSYIKVDMEFVRNITGDSNDRQVVKAIVDVARNFGIQTIAEGVESQEALELLEGIGVDYAQGYHIGRPAPVA
jgi:PAS domain S-box-containing protein